MQTEKKPSLPAVTMAAVGVVFGDIGTSPLYTLRECLNSIPDSSTSPLVIFGFLSLIFWSLTLIVSIKYVCFVMRADQDGDGGILTLMAQASRHVHKRWLSPVILMGLIGGSFFYGDGIITPAISVLSAIEGIEIVAPALESYIVPLSIVVLTLLFIIQKHGTGLVGRLFAPVMVAWFFVIGALGLKAIIDTPTVLQALNPVWGMRFLLKYHALSMEALGMVVLAVTGAEALYADMGHFGKQPIRLGWFVLVMPALVLNYFGQGALMLSNPDAIKNPFFLLAPDWANIPLLLLAMLATVIAAQAVISGVFSMTLQAIRQGYLPAMRIVYTSDIESGQIYIPLMNWLLFAAVLGVIIVFKSSSALSSAYGIVVTGTMVLTAILLAIVARKNWSWPFYWVIPLLLVMLLIDVPMFASNLIKLFSGGWMPVAVGMLSLAIMLTWEKERSRIVNHNRADYAGLMAMIESLETNQPVRVPGTGVFLTRNANEIPHVLLHNLKHNKCLHSRILLLTIQTADSPYVANVNRVSIKQLSPSFWQIIARYGWRETPSMPNILHFCGLQGLTCRINDASFFVARDTLIMSNRGFFRRMRGRVFQFLQRNAQRAPEQFRIPPNRVIELGVQIEF